MRIDTDVFDQTLNRERHERQEKIENQQDQADGERHDEADDLVARNRRGEDAQRDEGPAQKKEPEITADDRPDVEIADERNRDRIKRGDEQVDAEQRPTGEKFYPPRLPIRAAAT
ncbi:MAG: hypothetical protein M5R36_01165 [Deltaproteobacteria bacterium]|nr:hypothetical protein [Deltaproteobacteria bacterium]